MARPPLSLNAYGEGLPAYRAFLCEQGGYNSAQRKAMKAALYEAIQAELTERQRDILLQNVVEQRSVTGIALNMGLNKSTVSRHLKRAREKLGRVLGYGFFPVWTATDEDTPLS